MTTADLTCWSCGAVLRDVPLPVGRGEECPECVALVRVCRMCAFHDPNAANECHEPMADLVADKEAANACDYFRLKGDVDEDDLGEAETSRAKLEALFGGGVAEPVGASAASASLADEARAFQDKDETEAEASRRKLEALFGKKD